jgi:hypothetical protein
VRRGPSELSTTRARQVLKSLKREELQHVTGLPILCSSRGKTGVWHREGLRGDAGWSGSGVVAESGYRGCYQVQLVRHNAARSVLARPYGHASVPAGPGAALTP